MCIEVVIVRIAPYSGDLLVWIYPDREPEPGEPLAGHSAIIASSPMPLGNGGSAFRIFDSTGM
jgi:hypothetical protein